jgi:hypothetical protein
MVYMGLSLSVPDITDFSFFDYGGIQIPRCDMCRQKWLGEDTRYSFCRGSLTPSELDASLL